MYRAVLRMWMLALRSRDSGSSEACDIAPASGLMPGAGRASDSRYTVIPCSCSVGMTSATASCSSANTGDRSVAVAQRCNRRGPCCLETHWEASTRSWWEYGGWEGGKTGVRE